MENKNEKTFADLFSSVTPESNSKNENLEIKSEEPIVKNKEGTIETQSLTFDSLFDKVEEKEKEQVLEDKALNFNSIFSEKKSDFQEEDSSTKIENSQEKQSTKIDNFQNIFSKNITELEEPKEELTPEEPKENISPIPSIDNLFDLKEKEIDSKIEPQEEQSIEVDDYQNIFSQATSKQKLEKESSIKIEEPEKEQATSIDDFKDIFSQNTNEPKIEEEVKKETTEQEQPPEEISVPLPINPLFEKNNIEEKHEEPNSQTEENINSLFTIESEEITDTFEKEEQNPFFEKNESSSLDIENNNPFFTEKEENKNISGETHENNLFFTENNVLKQETKENLESQEENKNDFWEEPKFDKKSEEQKNEEPKNISPFFVEEKEQQPENPLFLEKINLIENTSNTKKTSNISVDSSKHFNVKVVKKKEPLIKFILGVISYALFIWLLLIGITLLVYVIDIKIRAAKGDYSSPTFNAYVVLTGSMLPEIQVYDVVVTKKVEASKLKEGDVITFASADTRFLNTIITHRIIKKNYDAETKTYNFQTQGDNNNVADSALVPQNNIYGKVILKIPKLGYLQEFLASDGGWIIVILIPCLTVISYDIVKLAKGLKKKKYKNIKVQK